MILDWDTHDILLFSDKLMFAPINSKLCVAPATVETINKRARGKDYCKVLACSFWPISRLSIINGSYLVHIIQFLAYTSLDATFVL